MVFAVGVALCFINDSNHAEVLWSYAMSIATEQSNTAATLTATRLLHFCIKSFHLRNDIKAHFTYLRLLHQLGHYDEFHAQVMSGVLPIRSTYFYVTHTRFNGPFSGTTQVSQYQKGKTNLDFTDARDSEWQWHQLGHMQVCTSLQTDNHASTPPL